MSGSIADVHQQAVAMLQASGAPMTTENLNRASLAVSQGAGSMTADPAQAPVTPPNRGMQGPRSSSRNVTNNVARQAGETVQDMPTPPEQAPVPQQLPPAEAVTANVMNAEPITAQAPPPNTMYDGMPVADARAAANAQLRDTSGGDAFLRGPMSPLAWAGGGMRMTPAAGAGGVTLNRQGFTMGADEAAAAGSPGPRQIGQGGAPQGGNATATTAAPAGPGNALMPSPGGAPTAPGTSMVVRPPPIEGTIDPRLAISGPPQQMIAGPQGGAMIPAGGGVPRLPAPQQALPAPEMSVLDALPAQSMAPRMPSTRGIAGGTRNNSSGTAPSSSTSTGRTPQSGGLRQRIMERNSEAAAKRSARTGRD